MNIGRKIFYDLATGNVIVDTGERSGSVIETTIDQDIASFTALSQRNRSTFDVLELQFGENQQDFLTCNSYRVNPTTKLLEFNFNPAFILDEYKTFKIDELNKKCNEDILSGFISVYNSHTYRTNYDDQINFIGKFNQLSTDSTITDVTWKTEDAGYIQHTRGDWLIIYNEALTAKEQKIFKYNQLKQQVNNCTTKEEVQAVIW